KTQVFFAVTIIMVDVIALILQGIKALIFNFPSTTSRFCEFNYILIGDFYVCDSAVFKGHFS
ncbi:hypothetical protein JQC92_19610, partial [Shewanella sp. 202IG2-18]|uniref:hypothetical protein n=1 Tax=Parashewanella hymeniacidonis TaxID=2807618 RepID=UPI001961CF8C